MNKAIGIFDSGVGGLTVVKEIIRQLPGEDIVYFGDTARVPYGTKSAGLVRRYAIQDARFLMGCGVKLLVVACNTVSAVGWEELEREVPVPVVGVIEPGCAAAVKVSKTGNIGVIGTEATISSGIYPEVVSRLDSVVEVTCKACPLFVPLVEEGWLDGEITRLVARRYLSSLRGKVDTLIPGCTHYPLLGPVIEQEMGKETVVVDSAGAVAGRVKELLREKELLASSDGGGRHRYFVSDDREGFSRMARLFLGEEAIVVEEVDIDEY
jgi:glutamate racemase